MDEEENIIDPFSTPDEISDVVFIVEGKQIFAHKSILAKISPVFNRMLFSNAFRETRINEIPLPGKEYLHITELFKCTYPNILKPIDSSNAMYLLPLSDEYSILILKRHIERYFISTLTSTSHKYGTNISRLFDLLSLSEIYRLNKLEESICDHLTSYFDVEQWNKPELSMELRCHLLELFVNKQQNKLKDKQIKIKQLEDLSVKQKFEIQRLKSELETKDNTSIRN